MCRSRKVSWKRNQVPMYISSTVTIPVHAWQTRTFSHRQGIQTTGHEATFNLQSINQVQERSRQEHVQEVRAALSSGRICVVKNLFQTASYMDAPHKREAAQRLAKTVLLQHNEAASGMVHLLFFVVIRVLRGSAQLLRASLPDSEVKPNSKGELLGSSRSMPKQTDERLQSEMIQRKEDATSTTLGLACACSACSTRNRVLAK